MAQAMTGAAFADLLNEKFRVEMRYGVAGTDWRAFFSAEPDEMQSLFDLSEEEAACRSE